MERPIARRELFSAAATSLLGLAAACGPAGARTEVVETAEGKVLQWERDELLVLVSGVQDRYRPGESIQPKILLNNQTERTGTYRLRVRLTGAGQQVVLEAPVISLQVKPFDAAEARPELRLAPDFKPGDYTLVIELPPWSIEGRATGGGALSAPVRIETPRG